MRVRSMPWASSSAVRLILMPGQYSMVSTSEVLSGHTMAGTFTHSAAAKFSLRPHLSPTGSARPPAAMGFLPVMWPKKLPRGDWQLSLHIRMTGLYR